MGAASSWISRGSVFLHVISGLTINLKNIYSFTPCELYIMKIFFILSKKYKFYVVNYIFFLKIINGQKIQMFDLGHMKKQRNTLYIAITSSLRFIYLHLSSRYTFLHGTILRLNQTSIWLCSKSIFLTLTKFMKKKGHGHLQYQITSIEAFMQYVLILHLFEHM